MKHIQDLSFTTEDLLQIAQDFGTPLYVYDAQKMKTQYQRLKNSFSGVNKLKLNYACKANTNLNILRLFQKMGSGLDTVSIQEVQLGLMAGFEPEDIIFTPNGVSFDEIKEAATLGVKINIDNLSILEQFGHEMPNYPVCIRLNPHILAGGNSNISVGHIDSKFGISIYQLPHILRVVENTHLKVNGLHMHTGSDILDVDVFLNGAELLFNAAKEFKDLEYLDFGSGFKVSYYEGSAETDIEYLGEKISERFNSFCKENDKDLMLMFEPGKFLVSESGVFLAEVNVVKQTTSTVFASVNSGFNQLIRPMFYNAHHEIENISHPEGRPRYYTIVGYICETDTFGANRKLNEVREKDILCFYNAGAYCFSMASNYNSRLKPAEILWINREAKLIRERESLEDLLKNIKNIEI